MPSAPAVTKGLPQVCTVTLNGSPLEDSILNCLVEFRVEQAIRVSSRAVLRFDDHEFTLIDDSRFDVGKKLSVSLSDGNAKTTKVFSGDIVSIGLEQSTSMGHELVIEALDATHRFGHSGQPQTYNKMSYGDVVRKIAGEAGLRVKVGPELNGANEYILRVGSIAAFLDQIAVRTGTEWLVDDDVLIFRSRPAANATKTLTFGEDLRRFKSRFSDSGSVDQVNVTSWDPATKQKIMQTAKPSSDGLSKVGGSSGMTASDVKRQGKLFNGNLAAETSAEAKNIAAALSRRRESANLIAKGEVFGDPEIKAGMYVTVAGCGKRMGGSYYLTNVEHVFGRSGDLVTRFTAGAIENASIVDMLGGSNQTMGGWGEVGLVVGLVTNNKDPEGQHRVKVKFPTLSDQDESNWARVVTLGAGNGRGLFMLPHINDEVLVGFEHGDLRRPFVLGSMWNGKDKPPTKPSIEAMLDGSKVVQSGFTTGGGHSLIFRDGPQDQNVEIQLKDGKTKLFLDKTKIELHAEGQTLELKCGSASITLESSGNITIKGQAIKVEGQTTVDVKGNSVVTVKSSGSLKLEGGTMDIKSQGPLNGQASGPLVLKGNPALIN